MAHILIMEDDTQLTRMWTDALFADGHSAEVYRGARAALDAARAREFDLVIVDIFVKYDGQFVPDGGLILISKLRQLHLGDVPRWWRIAPIIAVTGASAINGGFDPLRTARDMGADTELRKPFTTSELIGNVHDLLSKV